MILTAKPEVYRSRKCVVLICCNFGGKQCKCTSGKMSDYLLFCTGFLFWSYVYFCFLTLSSRGRFWRIIFFLLRLSWEGGSGVITSSCHCSTLLSSHWCEGWCLKQHLLQELLCDSHFAAALWRFELSSWRQFEVKSSDRSIIFCGNLADLLNWRLFSPGAHTVSIVLNVLLHNLKGCVKFMDSFKNTFTVSEIVIQ